MMDDEASQEVDVVNQGLMKDNLMVQQKQKSEENKIIENLF